jgi:hypothetical protein
MIKQEVYIKEYDWCVDIFYDVTPRDTDAILDALDDIHCAPKYLRKAENLLLSNDDNIGLTYSCDKCHKSVVVVGRATSVGEFLSTLSHELQHIEQAFSKHYGMNPYGEDIAYASGAIAKAIFENAWRNMRRLFRDVGERIVDSYYAI